MRFELSKSIASAIGVRFIADVGEWLEAEAEEAGLLSVEEAVVTL
jgi:hypothetical protein